MLPLVLFVLFLSPAPAVSAQETVDATARRIESQVWSPYCPGRLLADCTTQQAGELRSRIEERLRRGQTEREVFAWLRDNYGDVVLAKPRPTAAGLAIWLVPPAAVLAGAVLLVGAIRRWSRASLPGTGGSGGEPPVHVEGRGLSDSGGPPEQTEIEPVPEAELDFWIAKVREEVQRDL